MDIERFDHLDAMIAKAAQRCGRDRATDFDAQVFVHRVGGVVVAGGLLESSAAARIHDAATLGARAASMKAVGDDNVTARIGSLDRGARSCGAESNDEHNLRDA